MQLYKNFFRMIRAHRGVVILYLAIMVIYTVSMIYSAPYAFDQNKTVDTEKSANYSNLVVTLRDHDHSELSQGVQRFLETCGDVNVDETSSEERINDILYFRLVDFYIEIPEGFQESVEAGEEPAMSYISHSQVSGNTFSFVNDVDSFVNVYRSYRAMGLPSDESVAKALETSVADVSFAIVSEAEEAKAGDARSYALYMSLMFFCFTCLCVMCTAIGAVIIESNKKMVSDRIDVSPVPASKRNWSNFAGLMTCAGVIILAMMFFALVYGRGTEMIRKYTWVILLNLITTTFYVSALTLFVCSFSPKASSLNLISNSLGLSMSFLCGIYVPFEVLGKSVQTFAHFLPFFWSGKVLNTIYAGSGMNYTYSAGSIFSSLGVQVLFGVAFLLLAMIVRKTRRVEA